MASIAAYLLMAISGLAGGATMFMSLQGAGVKPCPKCKKEMMPDWTQCLFCKAVPEFEEGIPAQLHFINGPLAVGGSGSQPRQTGGDDWQCAGQ